MIVIGIEGNHSAIFDGGDGGAMGGAERAVTAHLFYFVYGFCWFGHYDLRLQLRSVRGGSKFKVQRFKVGVRKR